MKQIITLIAVLSFLIVNGQSGAFFHLKSNGVWKSYQSSSNRPINGWGCPNDWWQLSPIEDTLMFVDDGSFGVNPQGYPISAQGCNPLINNLGGKIAVIYRNTCSFDSKVYLAEQAGAIGAIIINREDSLLNMISDGIPATTIPAVFVDSSTGVAILNEMANNNNVVIGRIGHNISTSGPKTYIPFNGFEQHLIDIGLDVPPLDDSVSTGNIDTLTSLTLDFKNYTIDTTLSIHDLLDTTINITGLSDFGSLIHFVFWSKDSIDISEINQNELISLSLIGAFKDSLNFTQFTKLKNLDIGSTSDSILNGIVIANNLDSLYSFIVGSNNALVKSQFNKIDLSYCNNLTYLNFKDSEIDTLNVEGSLNGYIDARRWAYYSFYTHHTLLINHLNLSKSSNLNGFYNNSIKQSNQPNVFINNLDISSCQNLKSLSYIVDTADYLNLDNNYALDSIEIAGTINNIDSIDLSNNYYLTYANFETPNLLSLNLDSCLSLSKLRVTNSLMEDLDFSSTPSISSININNNNLKGLNFSSNILLDSLDCSNNNLSCLNLKNVNLNNINQLLAFGNPLLGCIEVDDSILASVKWTFYNGSIDNTASFSANCNNNCSDSVLTSLETVSNEFNLYPNPFTTSTTIELPSQPHIMTIYDIVGNKVREEQVIGTTTIERGDLTKGVYVLEVRSERQTYSGKLVVE